MSLVSRRLLITLVGSSVFLSHWWSNCFQLILLLRSTVLRCHWWSNGCQFHLMGEAQNCVITAVATIFQLHLLCETQNFVANGGATVFNYTCAKHRIVFSLLLQLLSITLVVRNTELRCYWWSNGFQLHLCEAQYFIVAGGA